MTLSIKTYRVLLCSIALALFFASMVWFWNTHPLQRGSLEKLHWEQFPNLISVNTVKRQGEEGILFIRLEDGKEQFIAGRWNTSFSDGGNAYAYGEFPAQYSQQEGQQLYYFAGGQRIFDIEVSNLSGTILSIQENPTATYIIMEVQTQTGSIYCIAEKPTEEKLDCDQMQVGGGGRALWNPDADHEAVIVTNAGELFVFDPWASAPKAITQQEDPQRFQTLQALFDRTYDAAVIHTQGPQQDRKQYTVLNILLIHDAQGWHLHRIPFFAKVGWLSDGDHVLVKDSDRLSVLELSTGMHVTLLQTRSVDTMNVEWRNTGFDNGL